MKSKTNTMDACLRTLNMDTDRPERNSSQLVALVYQLHDIYTERHLAANHPFSAVQHNTFLANVFRVEPRLLIGVPIVPEMLIDGLFIYGPMAAKRVPDAMCSAFISYLERITKRPTTT